MHHDNTGGHRLSTRVARVGLFAGECLNVSRASGLRQKEVPR